MLNIFFWISNFQNQKQNKFRFFCGRKSIIKLELRFFPSVKIFLKLIILPISTPWQTSQRLPFSFHTVTTKHRLQPEQPHQWFEWRRDSRSLSDYCLVFQLPEPYRQGGLCSREFASCCEHMAGKWLEMIKIWKIETSKFLKFSRN